MSTQDLSPAEREGLAHAQTLVIQDTSKRAVEIGWLAARSFYSHDFPLNSDLAQIQNADRGLRERGQQILDRLDHTAEDLMTDQDDDALDAAEGEGRR